MVVKEYVVLIFRAVLENVVVRSRESWLVCWPFVTVKRQTDDKFFVGYFGLGIGDDFLEP